MDIVEAWKRRSLVVVMGSLVVGERGRWKAVDLPESRAPRGRSRGRPRVAGIFMVVIIGRTH